MSTAAERLIREADDIRALAAEHGVDLEALSGGRLPSMAIVELTLRIVARALLEPDDEGEEHGRSSLSSPAH